MLEPNPSKRLPSIEELEGVLAKLEEEFPPPKGQTLEERAIEAPAQRPQPAFITQMAEESPPTGFFDTSVFRSPSFSVTIRSASQRFKKP